MDMLANFVNVTFTSSNVDQAQVNLRKSTVSLLQELIF